jgi:hypothetical protein
MTILWSNNASTTVSGSITPTSTSVQLAAGTGVLFPNPTSGNYYVATFYDQATKTQNEIVHVTAMAGDVATIQRAQEGTTAKTWGPGDIFANLVTAGTLAAFVQAGTGPANTSLVFVGIDTSTTPNLVIANTNPVPANYATGMLFNILIKNTSSGAVNLQLNGQPSVAATRMNGAAMLSGDLTATEEMLFIYNGVNFNTLIPDLARHPAQTVFYVNPAGNDNNSGTANTPQDAFATIQGAINAIKARYTSQNVITIRVADGTYTGGFGDSNSYIAAWSIIGNVSNPQNVVIQATGVGGEGFVCSTVMTVQGMTFYSYYFNINVGVGAQCTMYNINLTAPASTAANPVYVSGGQLFMYGSIIYNPTGPTPTLFSSVGGRLILGYHDVTTSDPIHVTINSVPSFGSGTLSASSSGVVGFDFLGGSTWNGGQTGVKYYAAYGGGIGTSGYLTSIPGDQPGLVVPPGWAN